jgi:hypothetical protein
VKPVVGVELFWLTEFERTSLSGFKLQPFQQADFRLNDQESVSPKLLLLSPCFPARTPFGFGVFGSSRPMTACPS